MSAESLTTYLNDHLAGSVGALEMLEHLIKLHEKKDREPFYRRLRAEVEEDQKVLQNLLEKVGGRESRVRKAAAWMSEKLGEAKLALDDRGDNQLRILEALETVALGIQGKLLLWRALGSVSATRPALRAVDFGQLERRARQQFEQVDTERLLVARTALAGS
jgi:vacuolar-type H+-ATPase subunit I/STV1